MVQPQQSNLTELPTDLMKSGTALQRAGSQYATAISVQRPRDLDAIVKALEKECAYAGKAFYYRMVFKGHDKQGNPKTSIVQGGSIGLAYAILREWGNCVLLVDDVREEDGWWGFYPTFIDLEKGVSIQRAFRARKSGVAGKFDADRKEDIAFQIGQSKASRNVVFAGAPRWMVDRCVRQSIDAEERKVVVDGVEASREKAVGAFATMGVDLAALTAKVGKPPAEWNARDLAGLRGDYNAIVGGEVTAAELFPPPDTNPTQPGAVSVDEVLGGAVDAEPKADADAKSKAKGKGKSKAKAKVEPDPEPEAPAEPKPTQEPHAMTGESLMALAIQEYSTVPDNVRKSLTPKEWFGPVVNKALGTNHGDFPIVNCRDFTPEQMAAVHAELMGMRDAE